MVQSSNMGLKIATLHVATFTHTSGHPALYSCSKPWWHINIRIIQCLKKFWQKLNTCIPLVHAHCSTKGNSTHIVRERKTTPKFYEWPDPYLVVLLTLSERLVGESQCLRRKRRARRDSTVGGGEHNFKVTGQNCSNSGKMCLSIQLYSCGSITYHEQKICSMLSNYQNRLSCNPHKMKHTCTWCGVLIAYKFDLQKVCCSISFQTT